jgi:methanogenic corrinoid protein MtbC1
MEVLKPLIRKEAAVSPGTVVIGTVFGDLHDIGKNLVKLLLESSGFNVVDLGENVPADKFVQGATAHKADTGPTPMERTRPTV